MKILVCGGRYYDDRDEVFMVLDEILADNDDGDFCLVHGACHIDYFDIEKAREEGREPKYKQETGADYFADMWARERGVPQKRYPAKWHIQGRSAGPKRNKLMFWNELPDMCVAFEGGKGTEGMKKICYNGNIQILDVPTCQLLKKSIDRQEP